MRTMTINIADISKTALLESDGVELRKAMFKAFSKDHDLYYDDDDTDFKLILNFEDIILYASSFFLASIGFFVLNFNEEYYLNTIKVINLTSIGEYIYNFVYRYSMSMKSQFKISTYKGE